MAEMSQGAEPSSQATAGSSAVNKNPVFEVGFHLVPSLDEAGVSAAVEKIRKALGDVEIIAQGMPERMSLAYTIERATQGKREKFNEAYFGWIKFALTGEGRERVGEIEDSLRADKAIMRYLLIETTREDISAQPRRAVFASDRLEGKTLEKAPREAEKAGEVSEEELDKSIEALTKE